MWYLIYTNTEDELYALHIYVITYMISSSSCSAGRDPYGGFSGGSDAVAAAVIDRYKYSVMSNDNGVYI